MKQLKSLGLYLVLLFSTPLFSQSLIEYSIHSEQIHGVSGVTGAAQGYYLSGFSRTASFDSSTALIHRLDDGLGLMWTKEYRVYSKDDFGTIHMASNGDLLIGGSSRHNSSIGSGATFYRLDTEGNVLDEKLYTSSTSYRNIGIFEESNGELVQFIRHGVTDQATKILNTNGSGDILSQMSYSSDGNGLLFDDVTSNGMGLYYATGSMPDQTAGVRIPFIAALNHSEMLWLKSYDPGLQSAGNSLTMDEGGNIYLCGSISDSVSSLIAHGFILKCNSQGELQASAHLSAPSGGISLFKIAKTSDGPLIILGNRYELNATQALSLRISEDLDFLSSEMSYDHYLTQSLAHYIHSDQDQVFLGASNEGVYVLNTYSDGSSACSAQSSELILSDLAINVYEKTFTSEDPGLVAIDPNVEVLNREINQTIICSLTVGQEEYNPEQLAVFPNPFDKEITIEGWEENLNRVALYDAKGNLVLDRAIESNQVRINGLEKLLPGLYRIQLIGSRALHSFSIVKE